MRAEFKFSHIMIIIIILIINIKLSAQWHPGITHRPRLIYLNSELNDIKNRISYGIYNKLWNNDFKDRNQNPIKGIYWKAYQEQQQTPNTESNPRASTDKRSWIAKSAAFVYAMNKRADGINDLNNYTGPNDPHPINWYKDHAVTYLETLDPTVLGPDALYQFPDKSKFVDNWQWRSKELIYYCQAYDMLLGAGMPSNSTIENKLIQFATNLFNKYNVIQVEDMLVPKNNHRLIIASALGIAAITLNNTPDASTWIGFSMERIDNTLFLSEWNSWILWIIEFGPQIDNDGGYAEGPYYFRYSMKHLLPFFTAMKNFNGDWTETYTRLSTIVILRSPWFDPRYIPIYDWVTKIRMPEGRLPALEDTYYDSYFPELAILGGYYSWPYNSFDPNISNEALLNWQLSQLFDMRIEYIVAGNANSQSIPGWNPIQIMPEAGSVVFRSGWGQDEIYFHLYGQNEDARAMGLTHDHADVSSFLLNYKGTVLALDPGYIGWNQHCDVNTGINHNLIIIGNSTGPKPASGPALIINSWIPPDFEAYNFASPVDGYIQNSYISSNFAYAEVKANYGRSYFFQTMPDNQRVYHYNDGDNTSIDISRGVLFVDKKYFIIDDDIDNLNNDLKMYSFQLHGNGGDESGTTFYYDENNLFFWTNNNAKLLGYTTALNGGLSYGTLLATHGDGYNNPKLHRVSCSVAENTIDTKLLSVIFPYDDGIIDPEIIELSNSNYASILVNRTNPVHGNRYELILSQKAGNQVYIPEKQYGNLLIKSLETDADFLVMSVDPNDPNDITKMKLFSKGMTYLVYENDYIHPRDTTITTEYHFKLHTDQPERGDSKNQRRVVSYVAPGSGEVYWNMVYEDGGDIWYTWSTDGGETWGKEVRMNFRQGKAKNPSLSNVFTFGSSCWGHFIISWVEEDANGYPQLHLQTMKAGYLHYGWSNYSNPERDRSHRLINSPDFEIKPDARPVVELVREGDNVRMYAAFEDNYRNIHVGTILFEGNGYNSVEDLYQASSWQMYWDYWNPPPLPAAGSKYPVLIHQPPVYSDETNYLYYIEPIDEEQSKITQYNLTALEKEHLDSPLDCYEFYSLQGTISKDNSMIGLTAHSRIWAGLPRVLFYKKYPHEDLPALNTVFVGMSSPSIMSENNSGYSTFISEILMSSTDGGWYRSNGYEEPEYVTNIASGVYTREDVPREDRASVFTRTTTIPAKLEYYAGTGELEKIVRPVFGQRAFRFGENNSHQQKTVVLDFAGTKVRMIDTLENRKTIAAIKLRSLSANGFIVRQPDSLVTPLGIDLVRNGQIIRSFAATPWDSLTIRSIPGIRPGDILLFKTTDVLTKSWGYNEFILRRSALNKTSSRMAVGDSLGLKDISVNIYPNPFNPTTTFRITLPEPAQVHLAIYNILGQKVLTLLNGNLPAGETEVLLDGNTLSSGIYFYRLNTDKEVKTGRLLLMK